MTAPSSSPPKPGVGSTGSTRCPSATRRVGVVGRECQTSSSASSMRQTWGRSRSYSASRGRHGRVVVGLVALDECIGELVGQLARLLPQPGLHPERRLVGIGHVGGRQQLLEAVGVERVALQSLAGEEEGGEHLGRGSCRLASAAASTSTNSPCSMSSSSSSTIASSAVPTSTRVAVPAERDAGAGERVGERLTIGGRPLVEVVLGGGRRRRRARSAPGRARRQAGRRRRRRLRRRRRRCRGAPRRRRSPDRPPARCLRAPSARCRPTRAGSRRRPCAAASSACWSNVHADRS